MRVLLCTYTCMYEEIPSDHNLYPRLSYAYVFQVDLGAHENWVLSLA